MTATKYFWKDLYNDLCAQSCFATGHVVDGHIRERISVSCKAQRELEVHGMVSVINSAYLLERERKMSITIIIILTMFYISYMPQYVTLHLLHFCLTCQQSITFHKIDVVFSRFLFINSAINPFIYAWKIPRYRRAFAGCIKIFRENEQGP